MSHMVIYRGSDGKPGYHQTDDIHDAVGFVESMRNDKGVEQARIFRLEEVVFEYKPYYRVELAGGGVAEVEKGSESAEISESSSDSKDEEKSKKEKDSDKEKSKDSDKEKSKDSDKAEEKSKDKDSGDSKDDDSGSETKKGLFGR